jgi:hypothetical protein
MLLIVHMWMCFYFFKHAYHLLKIKINKTSLNTKCFFLFKERHCYIFM